MDEKRMKKLDAAWDVYYEWLQYSEKCHKNNAFAFSFEQWLHVQYKKARIK